MHNMKKIVAIILAVVMALQPETITFAEGTDVKYTFFIKEELNDIGLLPLFYFENDFIKFKR